jgi:hypothetical protein
MAPSARNISIHEFTKGDVRNYFTPFNIFVLLYLGPKNSNQIHLTTTAFFYSQEHAILMYACHGMAVNPQRNVGRELDFSLSAVPRRPSLVAVIGKQDSTQDNDTMSARISIHHCGPVVLHHFRTVRCVGPLALDSFSSTSLERSLLPLHPTHQSSLNTRRSSSFAVRAHLPWTLRCHYYQRLVMVSRNTQ